MTDRDVVERVCELWGTRLYTHVPRDERFRQVFRTELVGGSAVAMMALLRPHLCARRQAQIDEAVATFQPKRSIKHKRYYVSEDGVEEFDRYWLAALLEGEGAFTHNRGAPMVELNTVDHDVILGAQRIYAGRYGARVNVHVRPPRRAGYQPQFHLAVYGDAARALMADLEPLMGERRRGRIGELLGPYVQRRLIGEARACYDVRRAA